MRVGVLFGSYNALVFYNEHFDHDSKYYLSAYYLDARYSCAPSHLSSFTKISCSDLSSPNTYFSIESTLFRLLDTSCHDTVLLKVSNAADTEQVDAAVNMTTTIKHSTSLDEPS